MPGGFVPYHHSTGKKYKNPGYTSGGSKSGGTGTGSATYGSPSNPYVPSGSSSSTSYSGSSSSSSSSSAAAAKAVAQAQAAVKAAKAVVSEYGQDKKNPKSVSGKYAKATEKAKKKRAKSKKAVEKKTAEVKKKYETKRVTIKPITQKAEPVKMKTLDTYGKELKQAKWNPAQTGKAIARVGKAASTAGKRHYFEDGSWTTTKKYERDYSLPEHPRRAAQRRSDALYAKTGLPGKAPKVQPSSRPMQTDAGNGAAAWVKDFGNKIRFSAPAWGGLTGSRMAYDDATKSLLLHEFAHTKQKPAVQKSGQAEGLATRYAAREGRRLGIPPSVTPEYKGYKKAAPAAPKLVMKRQFGPGTSPRKSSSPAPQPKYLKTPDFGPLNAYKVWEGADRIAARAKELSKGKTGKAETEATRNAARAAEALSRAVTGAEPKPRKVANRLEKAVRKATPPGMVPEVVPEQYRAAVAKYGKMLEPALREAGVNMSGAEYLGKLIQFESGWDPTAQNSDSGAFGLGQFMDYTAATFRDQYGVDPYGSPEEMIKAAAMHASGDYGHPALYAGYNPGYSDTDPILSEDGGRLIPTGGDGREIPTQLKRTARQTLGKRPTKAILQGGEVVRDPDAEGTGPVQVDSARDQVRAGAIQKPSAKEDKYFSYDHSTDRAWFDPVLQQQLIALAKASGEPIQLNSGFRTLAEQKAAYADYQAGGNLAATPGSSNHEFGLAADLQLTDKQRSMLGEFGLGLPVPDEDWHVEVTDPKLVAKQTAVNLGTSGGSATVTGDSPNIPIKGTNLAVKVPLPTTTGTTTSGGTTYTGGTSSTAAPAPGTPEYQQMMNEVRRQRGPSVAKRLAAIDRWMTSPVTAPTPEISQELIDRILGK